LYAIGALLFIPASIYAEFNYFLMALWIITCGLALLETTANPYILSMGDPETATQRLNFAQAFNPIGALGGAFVGSTVILGQLQVEEFRVEQKLTHPEYANMLPSDADAHFTTALHQFAQNEPIAHKAMQAADLLTVRGPYVILAIAVAVLFFVFLFTRLPRTISHDHPLTVAEIKGTFSRLIRNRLYIEGVIAQLFYVGAQIMCWTFIVHYGVIVLGMTASEAQGYNLLALSIFLASRFICTFLLSYIRPGQLLMLLAVGGIVTVCGAIFLEGKNGLYSLVAVSACMSMMFPTIYGVALKGMGDDASLASAGLIMAIVGGALMPPMQGALIDAGPILPALPAIKTSFVLPLICFVVIAVYGFRAHNIHKA
jgi:MFS transporter, FHS family, L-fucose permease